jgi:hypothetical protein
MLMIRIAIFGALIAVSIIGDRVVSDGYMSMNGGASMSAAAHSKCVPIT